MKRLIIAVFIAALLVTVAAVPALATQPETISGTFTDVGVQPVYTSMHFADGNIIFTFTYNSTWDGDLVGTEALIGHGVFHPNGTLNLQATGTFTGNFNGSAEGTAEYHVVVRGTLPNYTGQITIVGLTGGLAGLHGVMTVVGGEECSTYSGTAHFDP